MSQSPKALRVLILGGTTEAAELARLAAGSMDVITSYAGVTERRQQVPGSVRSGGFGGWEGLAAYLKAERIEALVDATHPFAACISDHARIASARAQVPMLTLARPGWQQGPGDDWRRVPSMTAAAEAAGAFGRVFLSIGVKELAAFAATDSWFLVRLIAPSSVPLARHRVVLGRGPFAVETERALLAEHRIEALVTKDSGGASVKLDACRELALPVIMIDRPPAAPGVTSAAEALKWLFRAAS